MKRAKAVILAGAILATTPATAEQAGALPLAMQAVQKHDWPAARIAARQGDALTRDIVEWHRLRAGQGEMADYRAFLARRPDWPGLPLMRQSGEAAIPDDASPDAVLTYFAGQLPRTPAGSLRLAAALQAVGAAPIAADEVRRAWLTMTMSPAEQAAILAAHGPLLAPLHTARLDLALWQGRFAEAEAMLDLVDPPARTLAETRLALLRHRTGVDAMIEALPDTAQADPGLAHARFKWRLRAGRDREAAELLLAQSLRPRGLGRPEFWSSDRRTLAHRAMREGRRREAWQLAARHGLKDGDDFAQLEWLAGYIALTRLDDPQTALAHFRRFRVAVTTPVSLGRAGYWEGRALDALGQHDAAQQAYAFAAEFQTAFYGQLAAIRAGLPMDPALAGAGDFLPLSETGLAESSVLAAARALHGAGETALFRRFLRHLAEAATPSEQAALGDLALIMGEPFTAIYIAKFAAAAGNIAPRPYFPIPPGFDGDLGVEPALALAVARRESEFNAQAVSHAGARGLMQLMPRTAAEVGRDLGLEPSRAALTDDPPLNIRLGVAYLAALGQEFDGYLPAIAAAYNAGPHRAEAWMRQAGGRPDSLDEALDWIETIPFSETRNYVMRVLEGYQVYRARLAGDAVDWTLDAVLTGSQDG